MTCQLEEKINNYLNRYKVTEENKINLLKRKIKEEPENFGSVFSIEDILSIEKEIIERGELNFKFIKKYFSLFPDKEKEIKKIIVSTDSINILFARIKAICDTNIFKDIDLKKIIVSIAEKLKNNKKIEYGYMIKEIPDSIDKFQINEKLKKSYYELEKKLETNANKDFILNIFRNYLYYIDKFGKYV